MSIDLTYDFSEAEKFITNAQNALSPQGLRQVGFQAGSVVGVEAEALLRQYPPSPNGRPLPRQYVRTRKDGSTFLSKFKSAKQQGYVFGVLVKQSAFPYRRTGELGRRVFHQVEVTPDGLIIIVKVGSSAPHAPFVIGELQNTYHTITGWQQVGDTLELNQERLRLRFGTVYQSLLERSIG